MAVDLRQFKYFIAVAEERHFGRAAAQLHIAQSGLSQQILKLERTVGVQLLLRDRRGVEITDAGRAFLDYARLTVELADRAVVSARKAEKGTKGFIRVGTPILGIPPIAGSVLQTFGDRFPDVEVELYPRLHSELIDGITTYALDAALVVSPYKSVDPPPRYQQLGSWELVAALPKGHRLAKLERIPRTELLEEPYIDWPRNINPEMVDHIRRLLFGEVEHPHGHGSGRARGGWSPRARREGCGDRSHGDLSRRGTPGPPGLVFRHFDEPAPFVGYGVAWSATQASPFVDPFLEVAREFADPGAALIPA